MSRAMLEQVSCKIADWRYKKMRHLQETDLVGKTIARLDTTSVNHVTIFFTDGSSAGLWAEDAIFTPYGNISGIFIEEETPEDIKEPEMQYTDFGVMNE